MNAPNASTLLTRVLTLAGVTDDAWIFADDGEIPSSGDVVVPLAHLNAALARSRTGKLGVRIAPTDDLAGLVPHLSEIALVVVDFPTFADGRGYSHAHRLRDTFAYRGEIRAIGDVGVDQLHYLARSGVTSFVLNDHHHVDDAVRALARFSHFYRGTTARTADTLLPKA